MSVGEPGPLTPPGFLARWIFSVDHKVIGKQFLWAGLSFLAFGGLLAMAIRWQWAHPGLPVPGLGYLLPETGGVLTPQAYQTLFTVHGLVMVFFAITPILIGAFGNCHIMQPQYDAWQKGSHHAVAVCVDCHLPEPLLPKLYVKLENGMRHGLLFTTQTFREPIEVTPTGRAVVQANCVRCHRALTADLVHSGENGLPCIHCHAGAGHGERAALGGPLTAEKPEPTSSPGASP